MRRGFLFLGADPAADAMDARRLQRDRLRDRIPGPDCIPSGAQQERSGRRRLPCGGGPVAGWQAIRTLYSHPLFAPAIRTLYSHPLFAPAIRHPLLAIRYSLSATRYPLLAIRYSLSATRYPLLAIRYSLLATRYSLLATELSPTSSFLPDRCLVGPSDPTMYRYPWPFVFVSPCGAFRPEVVPVVKDKKIPVGCRRG